jgi:hypothetical protein
MRAAARSGGRLGLVIGASHTTSVLRQFRCGFSHYHRVYLDVKVQISIFSHRRFANASFSPASD